MFPSTVKINGEVRNVRCFITDPVNHQHFIDVESVIMDPPKEPVRRELHDSIFTRDLTTGQYSYIWKPDLGCVSDSESINTSCSEESIFEEGNPARKRSFNKRILSIVQKIDERVSEFRAGLGNQLRALLDDNERGRAWQVRLNTVLTLLTEEMDLH
ncbi:uncharacterized protein LOC126766955 isoform X2 [Bactrocera neohumeralis]|uniref:uncharacterized protein LOC126766955 isoform X2 n=1 Tax=Bactrocera neohumeralis TaxID=98809 RepID=UPI0021650393|nr:uncharacterized protein LOC126766955 isoform X2 [Bactrocera neohumeralis]